MHHLRLAVTVTLVVFLSGAGHLYGFRNLSRQSLDPLPSWKDNATKTLILDFLKNADNPTNPGFIPKEDRIAALDLDGTLMVEKVQPTQVEFALTELRRQAEKDPSLKEKQPWKAALENDQTYIRENKSEILLKSVEGMSLEEFRQSAADFLKAERHPRYGIPYKDLLYKPMLELVDALREHGFMVYLVSGTQTEFIRALQAQTLRNIQPREIIGSRVAIDFDAEGPHFIQGTYFREPDNWLTGKAENIREYLGKGPVFVAGNSMADYEMLIYADHSPHHNLCLIINHDDDSREYTYQDKELMDLAKKFNWTVVSIKNDWTSILGE
ncbi:MAG: HAD family hydrolase [Puniceicoccales bacterium]